MPLSVDHVLAIEHFLFDRPPSAAGPIELALQGNRLTIAVIDAADLCADWLDRPIHRDCSAVGLCLPVGDRCHLGAIVDRKGRADWFVVDEGVLLFDESPSSHLLDDLCRRRLGRPTAPPSVTTDWYWLGRWLLDVTAAIRPLAPTAGVNRLLDMVTVAGWHPAIEVDELMGLDRCGIISFVVERQRVHAAIADWSCVRSDARADEHHPGHVWARHLDDGAFSRWMSGVGIPLTTLADTLIGGCSLPALDLVGAVISDVVVRQSVR